MEPNETCSECGERLVPGDRFCGKCGAEVLSHKCTNCGGELAEGDQFCRQCGAIVGDAVAGGDQGSETRNSAPRLAQDASSQRALEESGPSWPEAGANSSRTPLEEIPPDPPDAAARREHSSGRARAKRAGSPQDRGTRESSEEADRSAAKSEPLARVPLTWTIAAWAQEAQRAFGEGFPMAATTLARPPERWGWEYRDPPERQAHPDAERPPQRTEPLPSSDGGLGISALCILAGVAYIAGVAAGSGVAVIVLIASAIANVNVMKRLLDKRNRHSGMLSTGLPILLAITGVGSLGLGLALLMREQHRKDADRSFQASYEQWRQAIIAHNAAEELRWTTAKRHFPLRPQQQMGTTLAFGGAPRAWEALLVTLGSSLVADAQSLFVANLTGSQPARVLAGAADLAGLRVEHSVFPAQSKDLWDAEGSTWTELLDVVTQVSHSSTSTPREREEERQRDRQLLRRITEPLAAGGASMPRLQKALRVVMEEAREGPGDVLSTAEFDALSGLFGERRLASGSLITRASDIEEVVSELCELQLRASGHELSEDAAGPQGEGGLTLIDVDPRTPELDRLFQGDVLFALVRHAIGRGRLNAGALVVVGADHISADAIEGLHRDAQEADVQLMLLFEHLRDDAPRLLGMGGRCTVFMRLANHREASEATDFIGTDEVWKISQKSQTMTWTTGTSYGSTTSAGQSESSGPMGQTTSSTTSGTTEEHSQSESNSEGETETLQREHSVNPEELRVMPETVLLMIEPSPADLKGFREGHRLIRAAEFHPLLAIDPLTALD
jgi:hypothetical protein